MLISYLSRLIASRRIYHNCNNNLQFTFIILIHVLSVRFIFSHRKLLSMTHLHLSCHFHLSPRFSRVISREESVEKIFGIVSTFASRRIYCKLLPTRARRNRGVSKRERERVCSLQKSLTLHTADRRYLLRCSPIGARRASFSILINFLTRRSVVQSQRRKIGWKSQPNEEEAFFFFLFLPRGELNAVEEANGSVSYAELFPGCRKHVPVK